jgi:hypothetical protein
LQKPELAVCASSGENDHRNQSTRRRRIFGQVPHLGDDKLVFVGYGCFSLTNIFGELLYNRIVFDDYFGPDQFFDRDLRVLIIGKLDEFVDDPMVVSSVGEESIIGAPFGNDFSDVLSGFVQTYPLTTSRN